MSIKLKRLLAGLIDFYIVCIIVSFLILVMIISNSIIQNFIAFFSPFLIFAIIIYKDNLFRDASIGKKILKIKVVTLNYQKLSFKNNFKRALPLVFLPLEVLLIITDNKRLGDMWAKTAVVER